MFKTKPMKKNSDIFYSFFNTSKTYIVSSNLKDTNAKNQPIRRLQIFVAPPNQIRDLCLQTSPDGFLTGRIWNAKTINYKDLKPIPSGLFCERVFGPLQLGICSCKRTRWRHFPKFAKKLNRIKVFSCYFCLIRTIYCLFYYKKKINTIYHSSIKFEKKKAILIVPFLLEFLKIVDIQIRKKQKSTQTTCLCGRKILYIHSFFSISQICLFCISPTCTPRYEKNKTYRFYQNSFFSQPFTRFTSKSYRPGFCECGLTSTEVPWDESILCNYCRREILIDMFPRRYHLGYLSLALRITHIWYYHYELNSLPYLTSFSRRLFCLILRYERIVAEEVILTFRESDLPYFSTEFRPVERLTVSLSSSRIFPFRSESKKFLNSRNKYFATRHTNKKPPRFIRVKKGISYTSALSSYTTIFPKVKVCIFPWYCLYRDIPFFLFSSDEKKENFLPNYNGLEILNKFLVRYPKQIDYFLDFYHESDNKFGEEYYNKLPQTGVFISIRSHVVWFFEEPSRTGRGILSNRMLVLNQKKWSFQAYQRLKILGMDIETFKYLDSLDKRKRLKYRRSVRTRNKILVRLRVLIEIRLIGIQPYWLILQCLPILPPDFRPILSLGGGKIIVADINTLYQRVIERNNRASKRRRLNRFFTRNLTRDIHYHERLLQEAFESLFENNVKGKRREKDSKKRIYKSLAEVLKGKRGRFRHNLLGKRVDYSGRSVIVSGQELDFYQCGLPHGIVYTLFQHFIIRSSVSQTQKRQKIKTRFQARQFLRRKARKIWNQRKRVIKRNPVLLNRAPTLHRFGFQAFQPKLTFGQAIHLHPLVCGGFNADFDGDQISVHVLLSPHARWEALCLIIPSSHFCSPAKRNIIFIPNQDIILGTYLLTNRRTTFLSSSSFFELPGFSKDFEFFLKSVKWKITNVFSQKEGIFYNFKSGYLNLNCSIWFYIHGEKIFDCEHDICLYEGNINRKRKEQKYSIWYWKIKIPEVLLFFTSVGRIIFSSLLKNIKR